LSFEQRRSDHKGHPERKRTAAALDAALLRHPQSLPLPPLPTLAPDHDPRATINRTGKAHPRPLPTRFSFSLSIYFISLVPPHSKL